MSAGDNAKQSVDVYPVGWMSVLIGMRSMKSEIRYTLRQARRGNWRAVRNTFNGYLAEHDGHPHNCGRGLTRRAAMRRVSRICRATQEVQG